MLAKINFKKSALCLSLGSLLYWHKPQKRLCFSIFLTLLAQQNYAKQAEQPNETTNVVQMQSTPLSIEALSQSAEISNETVPEYDSYAALQNMRPTAEAEALQQLQFDALENMEVAPLNQDMANEIFQVAEQAKQDAQQQRNTTTAELVVNDASTQELTEINHAPLDVNALMGTIRSDSQIVVEANTTGRTLSEANLTTGAPEVDEQPNIFKRAFYKIRPQRRNVITKIPRISAEVNIVNAANTGNVSDKDYEIALNNLKQNIKAKLSSFTQESFSDYNAAVPQLRSLAKQAAQAVGFYQAEFGFKEVSDSKVRVDVTPNEAVAISSQNVEFSGPGQNNARFQVIKVLPEQEDGAVFHQGKYLVTKEKINTAASDNGFFDSYWRLHDVRLAQPENTADIYLRYETGERYRLGDVEFRMSDPSKPFPLNDKVLKSLLTWKAGDDYTFWRVNALANNLTNSRYFNYTLVDAVKPDPIEKPLELPPDIEKLLAENNLAASDTNIENQPREVSEESDRAKNSRVDEDQFVGLDESEKQDLAAIRLQQTEKQKEQDLLKAQAREDKVIPVIVTLNADKLNSAEVGAGFGTDTGPRVRGQYRRAIVNERGHSFDANMEVSQIRQSIDARYNIPYKHPLNDYIAIVGGYEREERDNVAEGNGILIESAVLGADRVIKNPRGSWQHTYGVRYRLDRIDIDGAVDIEEIPEAFLGGGSDNQQSLLFGYEVSRIDSNRRVNPTQGIKQRYKIEIGSESLLTDVNMAIINAAWNALYSMGEDNNHQLVGRAELGYILADDFIKVPYNLRYFSGGDRSIRGFDYKSLSPEIDGYKIGGQALAIGSVEYNYQFKPGWRAAVFADAGNAYDKDFSNPTEYGVGVGIRWASPIGSIRIDVASGVSDPGHPVRLHFFIGSQL